MTTSATTATDTAPEGQKRTATAAASRARLIHLDILRVLGAIAIVVIHVTDDGFTAIEQHTHAQWLYCLALDSAMRWAVPIFVMVSGVLLLNPSREETPAQFFRKRLGRIGIPVVAWTIFYLIWRRTIGGEHFSLLYAIEQGAQGMGYYHLWFVFMLAGLYLATPALRIFTRNAPIAFVRWTALGLLVLAGLDQLVTAGGQNLSVFTQWMPFVGYYLAGYAFSGVRVGRGTAICLLPAIVASIALMIVTAAGVAMHAQDADKGQYLLDEMSPFAIVMSLAVWILAGQWFSGVRDGRFSKLVTGWLAPATLGVYLVHPMVLDLLQNWGMDYDWHGVWIGVPARAATTTAISFVISLILIRIPVIKSTVGG